MTKSLEELKKQAEKEGIFKDAHIVARAYGYRAHDYSATDANKVSITSVFRDTQTPLVVQNIYTEWEDKDANGRPRVNSSDSVVVTVNGQEVFRANGPRAADVQSYIPGYNKSPQGTWDADLFGLRQYAWLIFEAKWHFDDALKSARQKHEAEKLKKSPAQKPRKPKFGGPR